MTLIDIFITVDDIIAEKVDAADGEMTFDNVLDDVAVMDSLSEAMIVWDTVNVPSNSFDDADTVDEAVWLRVAFDEEEGVGLVDAVFDLKLVDEIEAVALWVLEKKEVTEAELEADNEAEDVSDIIAVAVVVGDVERDRVFVTVALDDWVTRADRLDDGDIVPVAEAVFEDVIEKELLPLDVPCEDALIDDDAELVEVKVRIAVVVDDVDGEPVTVPVFVALPPVGFNRVRVDTCEGDKIPVLDCVAVDDNVKEVDAVKDPHLTDELGELEKEGDEEEEWVTLGKPDSVWNGDTDDEPDIELDAETVLLVDRDWDRVMETVFELVIFVVPVSSFEADMNTETLATALEVAVDDPVALLVAVDVADAVLDDELVEEAVALAVVVDVEVAELVADAVWDVESNEVPDFATDIEKINDDVICELTLDKILGLLVAVLVAVLDDVDDAVALDVAVELAVEESVKNIVTQDILRMT